jgi:hypothetical protein
MKNNDIRFKVQISNLVLTTWQIYENEKSFCIKTSLQSGRKNLDGSWDNASLNITAFVYNEDIKNKLRAGFQEKDKIIITDGYLQFLTEKRTAQGKNGKEYQETIYTNQTITINNFEFANKEEITKGGGWLPKNEPAKNTFNSSLPEVDINDDIPF